VRSGNERVREPRKAGGVAEPRVDVLHLRPGEGGAKAEFHGESAAPRSDTSREGCAGVARGRGREHIPTYLHLVGQSLGWMDTETNLLTALP
jgi:hypothetical protein